MEKEIRITNELDEITALATFVEELCSELSLSPETTMHINLALKKPSVTLSCMPIHWKSIRKSG